jgi:hypothetical protein
MEMSPTHYLPSEVLNYANFPEVLEQAEKINQFQKLLEPIMLAVSAYDLGTTDGIYVNIADVTRTRDLSYEISDILGMAPNVCYDVLIPIREAQESLNELIFSFQYEKVPVVFDKQRTDMQHLNDVVTKSGSVI